MFRHSKDLRKLMSTVIFRHFFSDEAYLAASTFPGTFSRRSTKNPSNNYICGIANQTMISLTSSRVLIPLENSFCRGRTGADNLFKLPAVAGEGGAGGRGRGRVFILDGSRERADGASNFRSSARGFCSNITGVLQEFATRKVDDSAHRTVNHLLRPSSPKLRGKGRDSLAVFFCPRERKPRSRAIYKDAAASSQRKREESLPIYPHLSFPQRASYF